jgi:biotin carboxyl carrier protein
MTRYDVSIGGRSYKIELERKDISEAAQESGVRVSNDEILWHASVDGRAITVNCLRVSGDLLSILLNGESIQARVSRAGETLHVLLHGKSYECVVRDPRSLSRRKRGGSHEAGEQRITASMPGKVVRVLARAGEPINAGQGIVVIEAMKMQNEVRAFRSGTLKTMAVKEGASVNAGEVLAVIE